MYQFSRAMYRRLALDVCGEGSEEACELRQKLLRSCEDAVYRLATDRHYFARPTRSLFREVRDLFPISHQLRAFRVIDYYMSVAAEVVDRYARAGLNFDGTPLECHATTRKGTPCQRTPLPGHQYCPSHSHLEEGLEISAA